MVQGRSRHSKIMIVMSVMRDLWSVATVVVLSVGRSKDVVPRCLQR